MCCFCRSVLRCIVKPTYTVLVYIHEQPASRGKKKNGITLLNSELVGPQNPLTDWLRKAVS